MLSRRAGSGRRRLLSPGSSGLTCQSSAGLQAALLLTEQAKHSCPHLLGLPPIPSEAYGLGGPGWPAEHGQGGRHWS